MHAAWISLHPIGAWRAPEALSEIRGLTRGDAGVSPINVLLAASTRDIEAECIFEAVVRRDDMVLTHDGILKLFEVERVLAELQEDAPCVLFLVGSRTDSHDREKRWLALRPRLVIVYVGVIDEVARIALRDPDLDSLLNYLQQLLAHGHVAQDQRIVVVPADAAVTEPAGMPRDVPVPSPLWRAVQAWLHALLGDVAQAVADSQGGALGFTLTAEGVVNVLQDDTPLGGAHRSASLEDADAALERALREAAKDPTDRLGALLHTFGFDALEARVVLLALAPEISVRFQRCFGLLLDDATRRAPTISLCAALLGDQAQVRAAIGRTGRLAAWWALEGQRGGLPQANEAVRLADPLLDWVLGAHDPFANQGDILRVRRARRWPGASLFDQPAHVAEAAMAIHRLCAHGDGDVFVHDVSAFPDWHALLERGADAANATPLRIDGLRLSSLEPSDVRGTCAALAWSARLQGRPLLLDTCGMEPGAAGDEAIRTALHVLCARGCRVGWLADDLPRCVRLLGVLPHVLVAAPADQAALRVCNVQAAARVLRVALDPDFAKSLAAGIPLHADGFEHAMRLARAAQVPGEGERERLERFLTACQDIAAEGASGLARNISPAFSLDDAVLPEECAQQLREIVDSVRLSAHVLDTWRFSEQLPYGRGIAALFQGPSGTGKTMSALGIAQALATRVLQVDLSRVVSKYIGETEKNIDRVFEDARRSGAVVLIDEADALLGKRSEVRDAHDRYANIEVAYLLQRIETHDGLAIFTTNLRQNLDPAFLRRLRFIVDFPRPDAAARERIWRRCLPPESHVLRDADFRQLARKIDLTGGHIRQITLRAAFLAAAADTRIALAHIARASCAELAKFGLPPVDLVPMPNREAA